MLSGKLGKAMKLIMRTLLFILVWYPAVTPASKPAKDVTKLTSEIFGDRGLRADDATRAGMQTIFANIIQASPAQLTHAVECASKIVRERITQIDQQLERHRHENTAADDKLHMSKFLLDHIQHHLEEFIKKLRSSASFIDQMQRNFWQALAGIRTLLGTRIVGTCVYNALAQDIMNYIDFEREYILFDYDKALHYFVIIRKTPLPDVINFWGESSIQFQVADRARRIREDEARARVQFVGILTSVLRAAGASALSIIETSGPLALQAALMSGGSMYNQWVSQGDANRYVELTKEQKAISDDFNQFMTKLQADRTTLVKQIIKNFVDAQKDLGKKYRDLERRQQDEYLYLMQSISLDLPKVKYLQDWIPLDQLFQASIMLTPVPEQRWYNLYQIYQSGPGDWEFDAATNSFWQRGMVLFGSPYWPPFNGSDNPNYNAIFTEYVSPQAATKVSIECQLVACTYPFFAGIMVNRARWLSGDPERLNQCRLLGLYGTQAKADNVNSRRIDCCFAQQIIDRSAGTAGSIRETIVTPLEQITNNQQTRLFQLPADDAKTLVRDPITYRFDLTVEPTRVTYAVFKKDMNNQYQQIGNGSLENLNQYLAIFNGIGFMAAGCQASFRVLEPKALAYTQEQLNDFPKIIAQRKTDRGQNK
jgi:hypothetical protein